MGGHYNKAKSVSENLKLHPALLSRFDLVFILIDKPNEELDCRLSDHIMNLHRKTNNYSSSMSLATQASTSSFNLAESTSETLSAKLAPIAGLLCYFPFLKLFIYQKFCDVLL